MMKLLHERLREWADSTEGDKYPSTKMLYATIESDHAPLGADDERKAFHLLANEIEKYYIPRPRFEDGEPVQFGDRFVNFRGEENSTISSLTYTKGNNDYVNINGWHKQNLNEPVYRCKPKILDAEGVEIKVGDKVYLVPGKHCGTFPLCHYMAGVEYTVVENSSPIHKANGRICISRGDFVLGFPMPEQVTHREPDSIEKLLNDMREDDSLRGKNYVYRLTAIMERDA